MEKDKSSFSQKIFKPLVKSESLLIGVMRRMRKKVYIWKNQGQAGGEPFFECLNSFERLEKPPQVITKCKSAIQAGLNLIDEAIVHGLLMSTYAKQRDLEKAQEELLHAREAVGKIIGLSGQELQMFIYKHKDSEYWDLLDDKVDYKENMVKRTMLDDILFCLVYPTYVREDLTDQEKRNACLEWWSDFPSVSGLYLLLGDLWATRNVDYAIECLKIVERIHSHSPDISPTIAELACRYKLGKLYMEKGEVTSAIKKFKEVLSALSHPERHLLLDEEKEVGDYWIAKAKKDLADIEQ